MTDGAQRGGEGAGKRYYGKYRGKVVDNIDLLGKGRIIAIVPSVSQLIPTGWANPCSPYAGLGVGMFFVPPIGANVWIEFEEGNPQYPIWTGGFWDEKDLAPIFPGPLKPGNFTIRTLTGNSITLSDLPPGIIIDTKDRKRIAIDATGIELSWAGAAIKILPGGIISVTSTKNVSIKSATNVSINSPT